MNPSYRLQVHRLLLAAFNLHPARLLIYFNVTPVPRGYVQSQDVEEQILGGGA